MRRVTAFVALAGIALSSCSIVGGGGGKQFTLSAWFPKTVALFPASEVRVLGLPAGKVSKVTAMGDRVRVDMKIKDTVPVPADVHATIVPLSLIGERYVQLFPVWTNGQPRARSGDVIPQDRTEVPVEPDEALAALKKFLDSLDPSATGRLVQNAADDLKGNGQTFNDAVANISTLVGTLADKDQQLGDIIDNFDKFTVVLRTREVELGKVMDSFANLADLLAQERKAIESTVKNLGHVSTDAFDLLSLNRAGLDKDLTQLTRVLQAVKVNIGSVQQVLDSGPLLVNGLKNAYAPQFHRIDLRTQVSPTVGQLLGNLGLGFTVCLPIDVNCTPTAPGAAAAAAKAPVVPPTSVAPQQAPAATAGAAAPVTTPSTTTSTAAPPPNPIDSILRLFGSGGTRAGAIGPQQAVGAARAASGVSDFLGDVARALVGVIG
ncbi:MAG: virulence factor Mce family protein [Acidimicrobiales bacterium]|nr:virulence factor Mce family protein [Acidimicrobiales bacterium]